LLTAGAQIRAFDPAVKQLPGEFAEITVSPDVAAAVHGADAAVVCTEWPQFRQADWPAIATTMRQRVFIDANRFLEKELLPVAAVEHLSVGRGGG
jgi:UDPglucose 6-dehydrogenase